ncbi:MAG: hypothetical protein PUC55_09095 [Lachnospiraceae bacterium]|nr:hypothetical protein [Lachnospiraceae bacterium]
MKKGMLQPVGEEYEDIIHLPHPVSKKHPPMSLADRAAQFSPFAALTGYEDAIEETARVTVDEIELDEDCKERINRQLVWINEHIEEHREIVITYFEPDERKKGGEYCEARGSVRKLDLYQRMLILEDGRRIALDRITALQIADVQGCE